MKKSILAVAGVAAFAGIAMPVAGAFATDVTSQTDTIKVNIAETCTMKTVSHAPGTSSNGTWNVNVLSGTMTNGSNTDDYGSTTFNIVCNNLKGWEVTAANTVLTGKETSQTIAQASDHSATKSGWSWTVSKTAGTYKDDVTIPSGKQGVASDSSVAKLTKATDNTGETFKVTYGLGIQENQAADEYSGTMTYTLSQLNS